MVKWSLFLSTSRRGFFTNEEDDIFKMNNLNIYSLTNVDSFICPEET